MCHHMIDWNLWRDCKEFNFGQINAQTYKNLQSYYRLQWGPPSKRREVSLLQCLVKHDQCKGKWTPFTLVQKHTYNSFVYFIIGCKVCCNLCNGDHSTMVFCLVITQHSIITLDGWMDEQRIGHNIQRSSSNWFRHQAQVCFGPTPTTCHHVIDCNLSKYDMEMNLGKDVPDHT